MTEEFLGHSHFRLYGRMDIWFRNRASISHSELKVNICDVPKQLISSLELSPTCTLKHFDLGQILGNTSICSEGHNLIHGS